LRATGTSSVAENTARCVHRISTTARSERSRKSLSAGDKARLVAPFIIYAIVALVIWRLGYFHVEKVSAAAANASGGLLVGLAFVIFYGALACIALPISPLAYAGGAVFGFLRASILVWCGSMLGAVGGYYLAHGVLAKPARRLLGRYNQKLREIRKGNVFLTALRLQVMPILPFGVFNYAAAISKLEILPFLAGTALGIIPGTLLATFIGDRVAAGVHGKTRTPYLLAVAAMVVVLSLSFAPKLWDKLREKS
jgi:uncharacterized membrane protein YdjX (TVP38/TMEM64 family)